ncbi:uncharacterized protein LOC116259330 [Nymphaea colorata]|nr:uncharacterized protein LOC116259330 [Nymphaea colorata]
MEASLMASSFCNPQTLPINNRAIRSVHRAFIFQTKHVPITRSHSLKIKSNVQNKMYEDHETGIVCYRSEDGELICEGLDEGPRYEPPARKESIIQSRETQILALLGQSQIELVEGVDFLHIGSCTSLREGDQERTIPAHFY